MIDNYQHYQQLVQQLIAADQAYYDATSTLKDEAYDHLLQTVSLYEKNHPEWQDPHSPTQRITPVVSHGFESYHHTKPMLSLDNVFTEDDVIAAQKRILKHCDSLEWLAEPKIDGVALSLVYEHGQLIMAATRGNGMIGDNVLHNAKTIRNIPLIINDRTPCLVVRGEVYLPHDVFSTIAHLFSNPRNAASGSLRQQDAAVTAERRLKFIAHGMESNDHALLTLLEDLQFLEKLGFTVAQPACICSSLTECFDFYHQLLSQRGQWPFEMDGAVYKVNHKHHHITLGYSSRAPRYAMAHKFPASVTWATVSGVVFQVGRTGTVTPVVLFEPVNVQGVTICRATLHSLSEWQKKDIRLGDTVGLQRSGDVIPHVTGVLLEKRHPDSAPMNIPTFCPSCNMTLIEDACVNHAECQTQQLMRLVHFVSRNACNMMGFGYQRLEQLQKHQNIHNPFQLTQLTQAQLTQCPKIGSVNAQKLYPILQAIYQNLPLDRFLFAVGLCGQQLAKHIATHVTSFTSFCKQSDEFFLTISGIGHGWLKQKTTYHAIHDIWIQPLAHWLLRSHHA
jgi:DNA ligase (NAD+)